MPVKTEGDDRLLNYGEKAVMKAHFATQSTCESQATFGMSDQPELSRRQIGVLQKLYLHWPKQGITSVLSNVLPQACRKAIIESQFASVEMKTLMMQWEKEELPENPPFRPLDAAFSSNLAGVIGYPSSAKFVLKSRPDVPIDLETVRLSIKENVVGCLWIFLMRTLPWRTESYEPTDLYRALRNPEAQEELTFVGKWVFGCIREHLVLPYFGSVEGFISAMVRLKNESRGFGDLIHNRFNLDMIKSILPEDLELHSMLAMNTILDHNILSPVCHFQSQVDDYMYKHHCIVWTAADARKAYQILCKFDHADFMTYH